MHISVHIYSIGSGSWSIEAQRNELKIETTKDNGRQFVHVNGAHNFTQDILGLTVL